MKRQLSIILLASLCLNAAAQIPVVYTLQECRQMALQGSASSRMQEEAKMAAECNRKAALASMFPKVSANAAYMWNSQDAHLLANQTTFDFGTAGVGADGSAWFEWSDASAIRQAAAENAMVPNQLASLQNTTGQTIADAYQQLYDALSVDLTHVVVGQVGVTQPIYVGGRLRELYNISCAAEQIAGIEQDSKRSDIILGVDEAYWRVISVQSKQRLAQAYYNLLTKLESDVTELVAEGMATQSDLLKVSAKRGEAEVKKLQAENGLILSRMALCQLCGMPLDSQFELDDTGLLPEQLASTDFSAEATVDQRSELQLLQQAEKIAKSNTKLIAAGLQPNIVASANYIYTNPNVQNGISNNWKGHGFFSAGVVVNIPIVHADDILRLKAAKHEQEVISLKLQESRELLILQATQANQKMLEAQQKIALAQLNLSNSEEALRMADESFRSGMVTASDLMMAQTAWLSAASDKIDAEVEAKMCETYLHKYTGTLSY